MAPKLYSDVQALTNDEVSSDTVIDAAYHWLCTRRRKKNHNADIWDLCWRWQTEKIRIQTALRKGNYRFTPLQWFPSKAGEVIEVYSARDALVQKAVSNVLTRQLLPDLSPDCYLLKGHGGVSCALQRVKTQLPSARFVCRSEVRGYYAHIPHNRLEQMLEKFIADKRLLNLLRQYMHRSVCRGENCRDIKQGVPPTLTSFTVDGCPLSAPP